MRVNQTCTLREIIDFCAHHLPALSGEVRPSENGLGDTSAHEMAKIFNGLAQTYPEAQQIYWGCRSWQLWMWQPVFVGVWAASLKGVSVNFDGFGHQMNDVFTGKYSLPEQLLPVQDTAQSIFQTASHLKIWLLRQLAVIRVHYQMSEKLAAYFLGDAVLKALSVAHRLGLLNAAQIPELEQTWQTALNLRCKGRLVWQEAENGFLVELTSCCQHFRRAGAEYCEGCPKTRTKRTCPPD